MPQPKQSPLERLTALSRLVRHEPDLESVFAQALLSLEAVPEVRQALLIRGHDHGADGVEGLGSDGAMVPTVPAELVGMEITQTEDKGEFLCLVPIPGWVESHGHLRLTSIDRIGRGGLALAETTAHLIGTALDRTRTLRTMLATEQLNAELSRQSPVGILTLTSDRRISSLNPAADAMIDARVGDDFFDKLGAEHRDVARGALERTAEAGTVRVELELENRHGPRHVEATFATLRTPSSGERMHQVVLHDITARRAAEHERETLRARRATAERLESLGLLAGGIAHDFNNLLTVVMASATLLAQSDGMSDDDRELVDDVQAAGARAAALVRQLMVFGGPQLAEATVFVLDRLFQDIGALLARVLPEDIVVDFDLGAGEARLQADAAQVEQLVVNLVLNARDAMPGGGRLRLATAAMTLTEEQAEPLGLAAGDWVRLRVVDEGHGMDAETQGRIFDPFFTTKEFGRGTGLGLAMVHGIARRYRGGVFVSSTVGVGTRFDVYLPRCRAKVESKSEPATVLDASHQQHILVIEDNDMVRSATGRLLEHAGFQVERVANASAALAALGPDHGFDVVLSDVIMPEVGGVELMGKLRERGIDVPIVLMSGYSQQELRDKGLGEDQIVLAKPFTPDELVAAINRAVQSH